jgi:Na+/proline symporter
VLVAGLTISSIPFGALLGVFLLGVLTRRVRQTAAIAGVVAGLAVITCVRFFTPIAWTWYVLIGATVTFATGLLASLFQRPRPVEYAAVPADIGGLPHRPAERATADPEGDS